MSWYSWEKELHSEAAKEDAEKIFNKLSSLFHLAIFYHLIYPTDLYRFDAEDPCQAERLQSSRGFLQELLSSLGLKRFDFLELLVATLQSTYKFIVSDLNERPLEPLLQDILENYTLLLYRLYPAFLAHNPAARAPFVSSKVEFNIYSNEILSEAVSPRFTAAMRMLSIRQKVVRAMTEYKIGSEIVQLDEHATVSAPDLAFLAGIAYSYVTKLFREGRLPAQTRGKFIYIPVAAAIAFTASRPTAPTWVKTLASQKNIAPRGVRHIAADYLL